jgi:hypothetical protein
MMSRKNKKKEKDNNNNSNNSKRKTLMKILRHYLLISLRIGGPFT